VAKVRSPNFPVVDLQSAIEAVGKIYARESRGKFPQLSAAAHLGYTSMNGRSLGMLAALRAYGLLIGRGNDLVVTPDAIALIEAPADSPDRAAALSRAFAGPPMFNRIQEQYPEPPSEQTLRWWLIQQGFTADGAEKAAQIFLDSRKLVTLIPMEYKAEPVAAPSTPFGRTLEDEMMSLMPFPKPQGGDQPARQERATEGLVMGVQERVLQSGMLSKSASYRLIVSGPIGESEFKKLIAKLEMDRDILIEPERDRSDQRDPANWDA
jgi:hypothetical protein